MGIWGVDSGVCRGRVRPAFLRLGQRRAMAAARRVEVVTSRGGVTRVELWCDRVESENEARGRRDVAGEARAVGRSEQHCLDEMPRSPLVKASVKVVVNTFTEVGDTHPSRATQRCHLPPMKRRSGSATISRCAARRRPRGGGAVARPTLPTDTAGAPGSSSAPPRSGRSTNRPLSGRSSGRPRELNREMRESTVHVRCKSCKM